MHVTITLPAPHLDALIAAAESNRRQPRLLNEALVAVRAALEQRRAAERVLGQWRREDEELARQEEENR